MDEEARVADGTVTSSRDGAVLHITLDRPSRRNSLSHSMIDALVELLSAAARDEDLRVVHLRGTGTDFCSGSIGWARRGPGNVPVPDIWCGVFRTAPTG